MIAIINVEGEPDGVCLYEIRINYKLIATFEHYRKDGLAVCLEKAAQAVKGVEDGKA